MNTGSKISLSNEQCHHFVPQECARIVKNVNKRKSQKDKPPLQLSDFTFSAEILLSLQFPLPPMDYYPTQQQLVDTIAQLKELQRSNVNITVHSVYLSYQVLGTTEGCLLERTPEDLITWVTMSQKNEFFVQLFNDERNALVTKFEDQLKHEIELVTRKAERVAAEAQRLRIHHIEFYSTNFPATDFGEVVGEDAIKILDDFSKLTLTRDSIPSAQIQDFLLEFREEARKWNNLREKILRFEARRQSPSFFYPIFRR